jgi:PTS system mannose-specific IIA component
MIGIVIATHGKMAEGIADTVSMIIGKQSQFIAVGIQEEETVECFSHRLNLAINKVNSGKGVIVFTDLFGATPTNVSGNFIYKSNIELVTGVNLPMILETCLVRTQKGITLNEVAKVAFKNGQSGIKNVKEQLMSVVDKESGKSISD